MTNPDLVVNISSGKPYDVYVGRGNCPKTGKPSVWGNPFLPGLDGTREEVIKKYLSWIMTRPDLLNRLGELYQKRLGCWCAPASCHASVLVKLSEELAEKQREEL